MPAASREPRHDPEEATRWFNQWHVYRSIVDADWMGHRGIFGAVRQWALLRSPGPFTLLDLGCGDAGLIKSTFDETGLWSYTGVDASQAVRETESAATGGRLRGRGQKELALGLPLDDEQAVEPEVVDERAMRQVTVGAAAIALPAASRRADCQSAATRRTSPRLRNGLRGSSAPQSPSRKRVG